MIHNDEIDRSAGPAEVSVDVADEDWWQRVGLKPLIALPIAMLALSIVAPNDSLSRMDTAIKNRMSNSGGTRVVGTDDKSTLTDSETQVLGTVLEATPTSVVVDPGLPNTLTIPTTVVMGSAEVEIGGSQTVERTLPTTTTTTTTVVNP